MFFIRYDFLWIFRFLLLLRVIRSVQAVQNWPITAPVANEVILVGQPYTITWENDTQGPVVINLNYGQQPVVITCGLVHILFFISLGPNVRLASTANNGAFVWVPASVLAGDNGYFLSICDINLDSSECSVTYDGRFHIALAASSSTTTTSPTSSITSTSSTTNSVTTTAPVLASSIISSTLSPTPTSTSTSTISSDSDSTARLNTGGVVGVTVGTTAALLAVAVLGFWGYKKAKKRPTAMARKLTPPTIEHWLGYSKPELTGEIPSAGAPMRLHGQFSGPAESIVVWREYLHMGSRFPM
ncbi:hypothetical protein GGR53DRAFT_31906 [Hypoxylon sp. FL1150]|nr:hypothetical protein GGR53DRAFT_31906 [Hypoxylon sp. FL1150]